LWTPGVIGNSFGRHCSPLPEAQNGSAPQLPVPCHANYSAFTPIGVAQTASISVDSIAAPPNANLGQWTIGRRAFPIAVAKILTGCGHRLRHSWTIVDFHRHGRQLRCSFNAHNAIAPASIATTDNDAGPAVCILKTVELKLIRDDDETIMTAQGLITDFAYLRLLFITV
jgi:hypothetical protein